MANERFDHDVVVIGSGFGGTISALTLARAFKQRGRGESVLMLERGTWWTTPVETVADKTLAARKLLESNDQPVQLWSRHAHNRRPAAPNPAPLTERTHVPLPQTPSRSRQQRTQRGRNQRAGPPTDRTATNA
jgi:choline dehydrogenase-like flavoprotein